MRRGAAAGRQRAYRAESGRQPGGVRMGPADCFRFDGSSLTEVAQPSGRCPELPRPLVGAAHGSGALYQYLQLRRNLHAGGDSRRVMGAGDRNVAREGDSGRDELLVDRHAVQRLVASGELWRRLPGRHQFSAGANHQQRDRARLLCAHAQPQHDGGGDGQRDGLDGIRRAGGIETGASTLVVVANGIASSPVAVNVSGATPTATATATPTPTATATLTATRTATQPQLQLELRRPRRRQRRHRRQPQLLLERRRQRLLRRPRRQ